MVLKVRKNVFEQTVMHAKETYPEECCGLLIAKADNKTEVAESVKMRNTYPGPRHNRYSIDPMELYRVDKEISAKGGLVVGIYHSHPEHPAIPSQFDLEHAWPGISYLVLSVAKGELANAKSWVLNDERTAFSEEPLHIL